MSGEATEKEKTFEDVQPKENAHDCKDIYEKLKKGNGKEGEKEKKPLKDHAEMCWGGDPATTKFNKNKICNAGDKGWACQAVPGETTIY